MKATINGVTYTIERKGYGQYEVSNGSIRIHTIDSRMIDAVQDEEDERHEIECKKLGYLFDNAGMVR